MIRLVFSIGTVLFLSSCQRSHELPGNQLAGSWSVSPNQLASYAEMYFHTDHTCFYFSLETGITYLGTYQVYGNTLFCEGNAVGKIRQLHEKKILLISDAGTDTLYFIDDLEIDKHKLINDEGFREFTYQFSRRKDKFYREISGINVSKQTEEFR